jgi:hypothetical protein
MNWAAQGGKEMGRPGKENGNKKREREWAGEGCWAAREREKWGRKRKGAGSAGDLAQEAFEILKILYYFYVSILF